jgi:hypothetical protein
LYGIDCGLGGILMWECQNCGSQIKSDHLLSCYNCGYGKDGTPPEDIQVFEEAKRVTPSPPQYSEGQFVPDQAAAKRRREGSQT